MCLQLLILSCMAHYHEDVKEELEENVEKERKEKRKHKKKSLEMEQRAVEVQKALETQIATEDERVEQRAQELAAKAIQARWHGKKSREETQVKYGLSNEKCAALARAGQSHGTIKDLSAMPSSGAITATKV